MALKCLCPQLSNAQFPELICQDTSSTRSNGCRLRRRRRPPRRSKTNSLARGRQKALHATGFDNVTARVTTLLLLYFYRRRRRRSVTRTAVHAGRRARRSRCRTVCGKQMTHEETRTATTVSSFVFERRPCARAAISENVKRRRNLRNAARPCAEWLPGGRFGVERYMDGAVGRLVMTTITWRITLRAVESRRRYLRNGNNNRKTIEWEAKSRSRERQRE